MRHASMLSVPSIALLLFPSLRSHCFSFLANTSANKKEGDGRGELGEATGSGRQFFQRGLPPYRRQPCWPYIICCVSLCIALTLRAARSTFKCARIESVGVAAHRCARPCIFFGCAGSLLKCEAEGCVGVRECELVLCFLC